MLIIPNRSNVVYPSLDVVGLWLNIFNNFAQKKFFYNFFHVLSFVIENLGFPEVFRKKAALENYFKVYFNYFFSIIISSLCDSTVRKVLIFSSLLLHSAMKFSFLVLSLSVNIIVLKRIQPSLFKRKQFLLIKKF